eukprot:1115098-Rhodomonas_salina.1
MSGVRRRHVCTELSVAWARAGAGLTLKIDLHTAPVSYLPRACRHSTFHPGPTARYFSTAHRIALAATGS